MCFLLQDLHDWKGKLDTEVNSYNEVCSLHLVSASFVPHNLSSQCEQFCEELIREHDAESVKQPLHDTQELS